MAKDRQGSVPGAIRAAERLVVRQHELFLTMRLQYLRQCMKPENLKVLQYELDFDSARLESIILERIYGMNCERWGIKRGGSALGKVPDERGFFYFQLEPIPSSRNDEFYNEFRWDSAEEALDFWSHNRPNIIATNQDHRAFYEKYCTNSRRTANKAMNADKKERGAKLAV